MELFNCLLDQHCSLTCDAATDVGYYLDRVPSAVLRIIIKSFLANIMAFLVDIA